MVEHCEANLFNYHFFGMLISIFCNALCPPDKCERAIFLDVAGFHLLPEIRHGLVFLTVMDVMGYFLNCKQSRQFMNLMDHRVTHYGVVTLLKSNSHLVFTSGTSGCWDVARLNMCSSIEACCTDSRRGLESRSTHCSGREPKFTCPPV